MADQPAISIYIDNLWVVKGGGLFSSPKSILQRINFYVEPGNFVAVVGPNGAGKTTLLKAIMGERPARGQILFHLGDAPKEDHESLYDNPEYWLHQIGYVPVHNILHDELTVRQALFHVGKLRLPGLSDEEILERIWNKLRELGFKKGDSRFNQYIGTLSSGERKRINIAAELLTDPPLLLLDEPTSNLDPNAERDLMDSLRRLAGFSNKGNGPTILVVTHTLSTIDRCNQAIFIANSNLDADGTPEGVYTKLEKAMPEKGFQIPDDDRVFEHWAAIFDANKTDEVVANRNEKPPQRRTYPRVPKRAVKQDSTFRQLRILGKRYFLIRLNDFGGIPVILISGFIAGFLMLIAPNDIFLETSDAAPARQTVVLYTILIVIVGAFLSHREVSKEFGIYVHERTKGLSPIAYLLSKIIWLSVVIGVFVSGIILGLSGLQLARYLVLFIGVVLLAGGVIWRFLQRGKARIPPLRTHALRVLLITAPFFGAYFIQLQDKEIPSYPFATDEVEFYIVITYILTCIAAITLGLMVSSIVGTNNDRATQLAIAVILVNVILAFAVLVIAANEFRWLFDTLEPLAASHWGYRGFSSSLGIYCWAGQYRLENFNSYGNIAATWIILSLHFVVTLGIASFALRLQETWLTKREQVFSIVRSKVTWILVTMSLTLFSWSMFLTQTSNDYFDLTYYDILYGGTRYAHIESVEDTSTVQNWVGTISESACGLPDQQEETVQGIE